MPPNWAGDVVARLTDTTRCPACGEHLASVVCAACGLNVSGREAQEVWRLSVAAADSLRDREAVLDAMRRAQGTMTSGAVGSGTRAADGAARPAPAAGTVPRPAPAPAPSVPTGPSAFAPPSPVPQPPRAPAPAQPPARPIS